MTKNEKLNQIVKTLCNQYDITTEQFNSKCRKANIVKVRQLFVYYTRYDMGLTFRELGEFMNRDTSTIIRCFESISNVIHYDVVLKKDLEEVKKLLNLCKTTMKTL